MGNNFMKLKEHILPLSECNNDFIVAKFEWKLYHIEIREEFDNCPCGHDIKELCFIRNRLNGNETYVGNVCVKKFMEIDTGNLFDGLKRIIKNPKANPNEDLINYAKKFGYIFDNEYKFLMDTRHKKKPSLKVIAWKEKINKRIINKTDVSKYQ